MLLSWCLQTTKLYFISISFKNTTKNIWILWDIIYQKPHCIRICTAKYTGLCCSKGKCEQSITAVNASPFFLWKECSRNLGFFSLRVTYLLFEVDLLMLQDQTQKVFLSVSLPYTCQKHFVLKFLWGIRCWSCINNPRHANRTVIKTGVSGSCLCRNCQLCQDRAITDALLNEKQNKTETH